MSVKCRCDSKPCAGGCPCYKAGSQCNSSCHLGKEWSSVPCLNNNFGNKVRTRSDVLTTNSQLLPLDR